MDYLELDCIVEPRDPFSDVLMTDLAGIGFDMFEEHEKGIRAYIRVSDFSEDRLKTLPYFMPNEFCRITSSQKIIPHQNWNKEWERNFKPVVISGKIYVRAAFHEPVSGFEYEIIIQPKMAFGTGHHETTSLMMQTMLDLNFRNKSVLDMGCGSGILAILAGQLGAGNILAVDYDSNATENAIQNCNINGFPDIRILTGGAEVLNKKRFDFILANINRNILLEQMTVYADCLPTGGILLISGFYDQDDPVLEAEANKNNFNKVTATSLQKWSAMLFRKG